MNERVKFIADYLQDDEPFSELCARAQISCRTGYKWVERTPATDQDNADGIGHVADCPTHL
jgi:hypothetical protein